MQQDVLQLSEDELREQVDRQAVMLRHRVLTAKLEATNEADASRLRVGVRARLLLLGGLAVVWVGVRLLGARLIHGDALKSLQQARTRGEPGAGAVQYSGTDVATAAEYPVFHMARNSLFGARALSSNGAHFLLLVLERHGESITSITWSGSAEQLKADRLAEFVQTFGSWRSQDNHFRWMFPTRSEFDSSVAMHCARLNPESRTTLHRLYEGGFCAVAAAIGESVAPTDVYVRLMARFTISTRQCSAQKSMAAISSVSNAVAGGITLALAFPFFGGVMGALLALGTLSAAVFGAKKAYDGTECAVKEGEYGMGGGDYTMTDVSCERL